MERQGDDNVFKVAQGTVNRVYLEHKVLCEQCKTSMYMSPSTWERFSLGYLGMELLGHKAYECSTFQDDVRLFSKDTVPIYITTSSI